MAVKSGKNDEAREKSRAALLKAGADLMVEHASASPFAALRLRSLCARAGYSTGAFYLHWASIEDYYNELARQLADPEDRFNDVFEALGREAEAAASERTLEALIRVARRDFRLLIEDELWDATELMNVTWGRTRLRGAVTRGYELADHGTGQLYASVLERRGREPRPPLDWDSIGVILQGLVEGLGLRHKIDTIVQPESGSAPGLYATAVAAVLAALTRPAGDAQNVSQALSCLFDSSNAATANDAT